MKFFKFGFFGSRKNSHFYRSNSYSNQTQYDNQKNQPRQDVEVKVDFEQEPFIRKNEALNVDNTTQFCIECGIKLPPITKYCNNCGTYQKL